MQSIFPNLRGGLNVGQIGGVMARAGVGKSAFLIHIALSHLLRGSNVLHISLTNTQAHVRSFYDELYTELLRSSGETETPYARISIERHRLIHSNLNGSFSIEDFNKVLGSVSQLIDFKPALVIIDGFDEKPENLEQWRTIAQESQLRLWISVRTHRDHGLKASDLASEFSTAIELRPENNSIELNLIRVGGEDSSEHHAFLLDPVTMMLQTEDLHDPITTPPSPAPSQCTMFSGGAMGSEAYFGEIAEKWGIKEINFTFEGHNQKRTRGRSVLSDRELAAGAVSLVYVSRRLHRHWDRTPLLRKVLQVLWHVVSHADQVFVVGVIQDDNTVHGGTGWSVELARRWHKAVWVFDQDRKDWFYWNGTEWKSSVPVISSPNFAGSGTRFLSDEGRTAINELFERSFGS
jgi:hypothetical protein